MLTKNKIEEKHREVLKKMVPLKTDIVCGIKWFNLFSKKILEDGMTCDTCRDNDNCRFAFDPYNTDGDCLAIK